ncbi:MAG: hypothetical protein ACT4OE_05150 [Sphingosinicella sp.]
MISGISSIFFGAFAATLGVGILVIGITDWGWLAIIVAAVPLWYAYECIKDGLYWTRLIPHDKLEVDDVIRIRGCLFQFKDIIHVNCKYSVIKKKMNFVDAGIDHCVIASLATTNGRFEFRAGQGPGTWFGSSFGEADARALLEKVDAIDRESFPFRVARAVSQLENLGYWIHDGKKIDADGLVHFPDRAIPLISFKWRQSDPFKLSADKRSLDISEDRSVFLYIAKACFRCVWQGLSPA